MKTPKGSNSKTPKTPTTEDALAMKVTELKSALKSLGASLTGKKDELCKRLTELIEAEKNEMDNNLEMNADTTGLSPVQSNVDVQPAAIPVEEESDPVESRKEDISSEPSIAGNKLSVDEPSTSDLTAPNPELNEPVTVTNEPPEPVTVTNEPPEPVAVTNGPNAAGEDSSTPMETSVVEEEEEEEDDEQRELREVEERKLREAVKLSMARQAVKKTLHSSLSETALTGGSGSAKSVGKTALSVTSHMTTCTTPHSSHYTLSSHITDSRPLSCDTTVYDRQESSLIPPSVNPATTHLRIDNFQRPLKLEGLSLWLQKHSGLTVPVENIWINSIKTHCYVDFESIEDAKKCREAVHGLHWAAGTAIALVADYTQVSAKEAETAPEAKLKPDQWLRQSPKAMGGSPRGGMTPTSMSMGGATTLSGDLQPSHGEEDTREVVGEDMRRREGGERERERGGAMLGMLRNAAASAANSTRHSPRIDGDLETGYSTKRFREGGDTPTAGGPPMKRSRELEFGGNDAARYSRAGVNDNGSDPRAYGASHSQVASAQREREMEMEEEAVEGPSLEDLFKKTTAKPYVYWLPVSDEEVERRQRLKHTS